MTLLAASFVFATAATLVAWARACRQRVAAEDRADARAQVIAEKDATIVAVAGRADAMQRTSESLAKTLMSTRVALVRARRDRDQVTTELWRLRTERERHTLLLSLDGIRADREDSGATVLEFPAKATP